MNEIIVKKGNEDEHTFKNLPNDIIEKVLSQLKIELEYKNVSKTIILDENEVCS